MPSAPIRLQCVSADGGVADGSRKGSAAVRGTSLETLACRFASSGSVRPRRVVASKTSLQRACVLPERGGSNRFFRLRRFQCRRRLGGFTCGRGERACQAVTEGDRGGEQDANNELLHGLYRHQFT